GRSWPRRSDEASSASSSRRARLFRAIRDTTGIGWLATLGPELLPLLPHVFRQRVTLNKCGGVADEAQERRKIFAEDEQPCLPDFASFVVALAFGEDEEVMSV